MKPLLLLGCGYTLTRLALGPAYARPRVAVTRDPDRAQALRSSGAEVLALDEALARAAGADVVVSFPPEAGLDLAVAQGLSRARPAALVYLSSTGVYGARSGEIDESTPVDESAHGAAARLETERRFRSLGGVVLRCAGIYGPGRGLHVRLREGTYRLPAAAGRRISRIHVDDLAQAILVALERAQPGEVLNVADDTPAPHEEVVTWLCARLGLPLPPTTPLEALPPTLRGDRSIRNARLRALGWAPRYPSYREGFEAVLREKGE